MCKIESNKKKYFSILVKFSFLVVTSLLKYQFNLSEICF